MNSRKMPLYIAVGLIGLCIASFFVEIQQQILTGLSIATLLFTVAQVVDSQIAFWNEDLENETDRYNDKEGDPFDAETLLLIKTMLKCRKPPKKQTILTTIVIMMYSAAFVAFFVSFVVPFNFPNQIGNSVSIFSIALLFLSIWLTDKNQEYKKQWKEVLIVSQLFRKRCETQKIIRNMENQQDGQDEI